MKTHTSGFKEQIKLIGKGIDSKITFGDTVLGKDDLNAVTPSYQGAILKSVMKQLDIDSNVAIPIGTILKYEFGLKVNGEYEYINYGNYVVYSIEKQEDTNSYKIVCYDKLLYSMLDYVKLPITYPISIRDYINAISTVLGLTFANKSGTFANYDKQIQADLYDGLGYTFRDILDELAQVTASTICLNNNDELEIRYITETGDTIDEEFLKDVNVNFGEKFGSVNTIVLSRSADSDSVYYPPVLPANPYEIKISDNQIMNGNDRADFLPDIYNKLNGLEFYTNDFVSTGIIYYDLCDRYSVKVGDNTYSCVMFNDEVLVTQGLEENIYTELPEQTETDYKHASKDDRMINQVYIIAKKNEAEILAVVDTTNQIQKEINPTKNESGPEITIEDASNNPLTYLEIEGKSTQDGTPTPDTPIEIESVGYENSFDEETLSNYSNYTETLNNNYVGYKKQLKPNTTYTIKVFNNGWVGTGGWIYRIYNSSNSSLGILQNSGLDSDLVINFTTDDTGIIYFASIYGSQDRFTNWFNSVDILLVEGTQPYSYIPYGKYGIEVETVGKNTLKYNWNKGFSTTTNGITFKINDDYSVTINGTATANAFLNLNNVEGYYNYITSGKTYTAYIGVAEAGLTIALRDTNGNALIYATNTKQKSWKSTYTGNTSMYLRVASGYTYNNLTVYPMLVEGDSINKYEPYQSNKTVIVLDEPLRSSKDNTKDKLYIKNNKLYIDRYIGSKIYDGSNDELWSIYSQYNTDGGIGQCYQIQDISFGFGTMVSKCSHFKNVTSSFMHNIGYVGSYCDHTTVHRKYFISDKMTLEEWKVWLSENNIQVDYELATPITEELDEIEMLKTLKGYNDISTTDKLLPIINLTYVRDTIIADYVENHVTELKLTEKEIKASVESVSSSVDGLNTTINRVEEITNDNSQVINVISTNIDRTSGEVREVTTTTGFTFNADGMTIDDGSGFKAEHTADGTYYKDGNSIVGQYTKDGSKQKDLELFGIYSYGKESIDDTPMFIGQLYRDENNEQCFGHFYNGGE